MQNILKEIALFYQSLEDKPKGYEYTLSLITLITYLVVGCTGTFYKLISLFLTIPLLLISLSPLIIDYASRNGSTYLQEISYLLSDDMYSLILYIVSTFLLSFLIYFFGAWFLFFGLIVFLQMNVELSLANFLVCYFIITSFGLLICVFFPFFQNAVCCFFISSVCAVMTVIGWEKVVFDLGVVKYVLDRDIICLYDKEFFYVVGTFLFFFGMQVALGAVLCKLPDWEEEENSKENIKEGKENKENIKEGKESKENKENVNQ